MYYLVQMYGRLAAIPEPNMGLVQLESGAGKVLKQFFLKQRCSSYDFANQILLFGSLMHEIILEYILKLILGYF